MASVYHSFASRDLLEVQVMSKRFEITAYSSQLWGIEHYYRHAECEQA